MSEKNVIAKSKIWIIGFLLLLGFGSANTIYNRITNARVLEKEVENQTNIYVKLAVVKNSDTPQVLKLPGTLLGFSQSPIAARASGYVKKWYTDIGSVVKKGEVLAEIDTPELDQLLAQLFATQQQASESMQLAKLSLERWEALRKKDVVSQQEYEEKKSLYSQATANYNAASANAERTRQLTVFKKVIAPYSGVITKRFVDIGDLIDGTTKPLFLIAKTDPLRVYINVPQSYTPWIKIGQGADITLDEQKGRVFIGEVTKLASAIDPTSRTMQVEVSLGNKEKQLLPGAFVQVNLKLPASNAINIPSNTLLIRKEGIQVAIVDEQNKVSLQKIKLGRDYGVSSDVIDGLKGGERLVLNPSDSLSDGDIVTIVADEVKKDNKPVEIPQKAKP
ncbi:MAG: efflux RND transporter periplasmic adaptor subunit [Betaproteobacteria bacterium]|nr:efflux RND transporter periplasmic adaptor subunit [Betaproteobacteria bacterium]